MRATSSSTRQQKKPLMSWASKSCPPSRACRQNIPSYLLRKSGITLNCPAPVRKRNACKSTRPTPNSCSDPTSRKRRKPESVSRKNSTASQGAAEQEPVRSYGVLGSSPTSKKGRFPSIGNLPFRQVCINAGIACQAGSQKKILIFSKKWSMII